MGKVLKKKVFLNAFKSLPDMPDENAQLKILLAEVPEADRQDAEKAFYNTLRIMKAKTPVEVEDIPFAEVLLCFEYQEVFNEVFCTDKSGVYLRSFKDGFEKAKTCRVRRVL